MLRVVVVLWMMMLGYVGDAEAVTATATKTLHKIVFESGASFMTLVNAEQKVVGVPVKVGLSTGKKALWGVAGLASAGTATIAGVLTDPSASIMSEEEERALLAAYNQDTGQQLYLDGEHQIRDYATTTYSSSKAGEAKWKQCTYDMWNKAHIDGFTVGTGWCEPEAANHGWSCNDWVVVRISSSYQVSGPGACSGSGTSHYEADWYLKPKTLEVSQTVEVAGAVVDEGTWKNDLQAATSTDPASNTAKAIVDLLNGELGKKLDKAINDNDLSQGLTQAQIDLIKDTVLDAVPDSVWNDVEESNSPDSIAQSEGGSEDSAESVRKGLEEYFSGESVNIGTISEEADPSVPDKDSLSSKLDIYWSSVQSLPMVSGISSATLNASGGNPIVSCDIPQFLNEGGHHLEFNFSSSVGGVSYADMLGAVGGLLLMIVSLRWGLYVLKSE